MAKSSRLLCMDCVHFHSIHTPGAGHCRRRPPRQHQGRTRWPQVDTTQWCSKAESPIIPIVIGDAT